jgi:hypothetical protein
MGKERQMSVRLFVGVPGSGKTQAMIDFCMASQDEQLFGVVDRAGEWGDLNSPRWRGKRPNAVIVPHNVEGKMPDEVLNTHRGFLIFQHPWEGEAVAELIRQRGEAVYVDDEIDLVAIYKGWIENPLRDFVHRGRHLPNAEGIPSQVDILGAARRIQNLHSDVTSMADECFVFRSQGKYTIKRLVEEGFIDDSEEAITQVRNFKGGKGIPTMEFLLWKSDGTRALGTIKNPFMGKSAK